MDKKIIEFLRSNTVLTLATSVNDVPWCAHCFYVFDESNSCLFFMSDAETLHIQQVLKNSTVAGGIAPDKLVFTQIKGIQFTGKCTPASGDLKSTAMRMYYLKYPIAVGMKGNFYAIELESIKMTDNTLGFGTKLNWRR